MTLPDATHVVAIYTNNPNQYRFDIQLQKRDVDQVTILDYLTIANGLSMENVVILFNSIRFHPLTVPYDILQTLLVTVDSTAFLINIGTDEFVYFG